MIHTCKQAVVGQLADIALRIKLEKPFSKEIRDFLLEIYKLNDIMFRNTGNIIGTQRLIKPFADILKTNYDKIAGSFKGRTFKDLFKDGTILDGSRIVRQLGFVMAAYIFERSPLQSALIMQNLETEIKDLTKRITSDLILAGSTVNNETVGNLVSEQLTEQSEAKSETIAMTETLNLSEKTKDSEANIVSNAAIAVGASQIITKTWRATFVRTRPAHAKADGQVRRVAESFSVGGEALLFPGDSRGSAENIINCHCFVEYGFQ